MSELKPCPWIGLGGPHALRINTNRGFTSVRCGCGATGPVNFSKELAIEAWNAQAHAEPPKQTGTVEVESIIRKHLNSMPVNFDRIDEARKLATDLRRFVTPVQPSAVVSREAIEDCILDAIREATGEDPSIDDDADAWLFSTKIHALQLPQPVTPVQSRGVEPSESDLSNGWNHSWKSLNDAQELIRNLGEDISLEQVDAAMTVLTTTQSAPVADTAPSRWISVTEKLPEIGEVVLIASKESFYRVALDELAGMSPVLWDFYGTDDVTHWQPLPAPPVKGAV